MAYLLDHAPASSGAGAVHAGRAASAAVSAARKGELLEIASADLRFSIADAHTLLVAHQGLVLEHVRRGAPGRANRRLARGAVYGGPVVGRPRRPPGDFIDAFAGDDRNVVDYLTTEVLAGQAAATRAFMLATSVLDRLCAPLCDQVVGGAGSAAVLRDIERSNSFLIALDNRREWYRYHHLFRELLRNELLSTDPAAAATANRRAATWLRGRGLGLGSDLAPGGGRGGGGGRRAHRFIVASFRELG